TGTGEAAAPGPLPSTREGQSSASTLKSGIKRREHSTGEPARCERRPAGFVELPVEDVYASLDARTPRRLAPRGADSLQDELSASVPPSRRAVRDPIQDADPSGQYEPVIAPTGSPSSARLQSDPVRRLDEVMATLS